MSIERFGSGFAAAVALAVGLVFASAIGGLSFIKGKRGDQTITVTGSARKRIRSDLVIWKAGVSYQAPVLADAYSSLSENVPKVKSYLIGKGIPENQITISSISSQTLHARNDQGEDTGAITGYSLRQELEVRSNDVDKIAKVAREATELINQGILLESMAPEYHYTKLGEEKITMLAEAAKDAKVRAERVAESTGSSIGSVRTARMGVLQITPADSNEVSDSGMNDTSSLEKDITAVVNVGFEID
ncbi:MAG TPA: SIMPL domain-containing protein [Pyrinomonadaceae bacterium]|nr:SIMPL domain-containing protein [Pyrinomonadaceae bacterium]